MVYTFCRVPTATVGFESQQKWRFSLRHHGQTDSEVLTSSYNGHLGPCLRQQCSGNGKSTIKLRETPNTSLLYPTNFALSPLLLLIFYYFLLCLSLCLLPSNSPIEMLRTHHFSHLCSELVSL